MARLLYAATPADYVINSGTGRPESGVTVTVYTAVTGGTQVTDLLTAGGTPITTVTTDSAGGFRFQGPDGTDATLWVSVSGGTRFAVNVADLGTTRAPLTHTHDSLFADHLSTDDHLGSHADSSHTGANKVQIARSGSNIGTRKRINLIQGTDVTLTVADNSGTDSVDVTIAATSGLTAPGALRSYEVTFAGDAATGYSQFIEIGQPCILKSIRQTSTTSPTTSSVVHDVLLSGRQAEASIFSDAGARPTLRAGEGSNSTWGRDYAFAAGDRVRVQQASVDSGNTAANVSVVLEVEVSATSYLETNLNSCEGNSVADEDDVTTGNSGGTDNAWDSVTDPATAGAEIKYDTAHLPSGYSFAHRVSTPLNTTADTFAAWTFTDANTVYGRGLYYFTANPGSSVRIARLRDGGTAKVAVNVTTQSRIQVTDASGTQVLLTDAGTPLTLNQFVRIEWKITGGPDGRAVVWIYNTHTSTTASLVAEAASSDMGTVYDEVNFGRTATSGSSAQVTFWQAGLGVSTQGLLGIAT